MSQLSVNAIPNTFKLQVTARQVSPASHSEQLLRLWQQAQQMQVPFLVLGEGSNTLFTANFAGIVALNRIKGIDVYEDAHYWYLKVGAGEIWHQLVTYCVKQGYAGLENLALIPGCVGSAPIQNIGAYGVEFERVADYVDLLDFNTGQIVRVQDGQYAYRESVFKHHYRDYAVVAVGIKLAKHWQPVLNYGELKQFSAGLVSSQQIYDKVCEIRRLKLPDPTLIGNGGSFFKNPIVTLQQAQALLCRYPNMPMYPQADKQQVKLAAGWLIDQCGLKGYQIGGAAVHQKQALVLINQGAAEAQDVIDLARYIRQHVRQMFAVELEPEIRFIASQGEIDPATLL